MTLVENAGKAWKWFSMQAMGLAAVVQSVWVALPDDARESLPRSAVQWATLGLLLCGIVGRLVKQEVK